MKAIRSWLFISLFVAGIISLFASSHPDGYEKAGEELGFIEKATTFFNAPFPDYQVPGISHALSGSLAGIVGVIVTFIIFLVIGKLIGRKR
jgi:cobalt/nickel transport protein